MYEQSHVTPLEQRGSSSINGTAHLCSQLPTLFEKYNIKTMFDAGANDAAWQIQTLAHLVEYHAGERNADIVAIAKLENPTLDIQLHDITKDPLPDVDLLFVRDVAIHLNDSYKQQMLTNWLSSSIPWILMTQLDYTTVNYDDDQTKKRYADLVITPPNWFFAEINWHLAPWNFPEPIAKIEDAEEVTSKTIERFMCLWHRDQLKGLTCLLPE